MENSASDLPVVNHMCVCASSQLLFFSIKGHVFVFVGAIIQNKYIHLGSIHILYDAIFDPPPHVTLG